jgi:hypothetical protein
MRSPRPDAWLPRLQDKGDREGADSWLQIIVAIGELQRNTTARPS